MKSMLSPICRKGERNVYCPNYNDCLDHAVDHKWRYWSCSECSFKMIQERSYPVRTVDDSNICYELPSNFSQEMWQSWG